MGDLDCGVIHPLVCICIPVRNGGSTIGQTLTSLLKQDYPNFEIVVCDNMSTDNTRQVLNDLIPIANIPISIMNNTTPGTAEDNWNFLLNNLTSKAEYLGLYHADDLYHPTIVSKQVGILSRKPVGAVFSLSYIIDESNVDISKKIKHTPELANEISPEHIFDHESLMYYTMKHYNFIKTPTFFFRRDILKNYSVFFDTKYKTSADLDFWLRIAGKDKIAILREPLHYYRITTFQGSYTLLKGKTKPADYFAVMSDHIESSINLDSIALKWHRAHESMDFVMCALNLAKVNKRKEALIFLKYALKIEHVPFLVQITNGVKNFLFGFALRAALWTGLEKTLIKAIGH